MHYDHQKEIVVADCMGDVRQLEDGLITLAGNGPSRQEAIRAGLNLPSEKTLQALASPLTGLLEDVRAQHQGNPKALGRALSEPRTIELQGLDVPATLAALIIAAGTGVGSFKVSDEFAASLRTTSALEWAQLRLPQ